MVDVEMKAVAQTKFQACLLNHDYTYQKFDHKSSLRITILLQIVFSKTKSFIQLN